MLSASQLPNFGQNIDHDDGSAYYNDSYNVLVGGGGWTKHSGPFQQAIGNIWIQPPAPASPVRRRDQPCASTNPATGMANGPFNENTCIGYGAMNEATCNTSICGTPVGGTCTPYSSSNTFFVDKQRLSVVCKNVSIVGAAGHMLTFTSLAAAQKSGAEPNSVAKDLGGLTANAMAAMIRKLLSF